MTLKKNYTLKELNQLWLDGAVINRDYSTDTWGTSSMGYMERRGITINGEKYQVIYTSKGYGRITSDIVFYNGRSLPKHEDYIQNVEDHFNKNFELYL